MQMNPETQAPAGQSKLGPQTSILLVILIISAILIGLYWRSRYGGDITEGDSQRMTADINNVYTSETINPSNGAIYVSGFGFPVIMTFISHLTNLSVHDLQLDSPIWFGPLILIAFLAYRELLRSAIAALTACFLLMLMPDFVFYIMRLSHEKATWMFALLLVYLLARSYRMTSLRAVTVNGILFYLVFWAMASTNVFFSSTLLTATAFSFVACQLLLRLNRFIQFSINISVITRFILITLTGFVVIYSVIAYIYPPAKSYYYYLPIFQNRLQTLFIGEQSTQIISSAGIAPALTWRSSLTYLLLTIPQWTIVLISAASWIAIAWSLVRKKFNSQLLLIWLLYGAVTFQALIAIVIDTGGFLLIENLTVRLFTTLALFAAPLASHLIIRVLTTLMNRERRVQMLSVVALTIVVAFSSLFMLLKIVNDPVVSNLWIFYLPQQVAGVAWLEDHLVNQQVYVDLFPIKRDAFLFDNPTDNQTLNYYFSGSTESINRFSYILTSQITQYQANLTHATLPMTVSYDQIYDNGDVKIYRFRPRNPFQQ